MPFNIHVTQTKYRPPDYGQSDPFASLSLLAQQTFKKRPTSAIHPLITDVHRDNFITIPTAPFILFI